jgi:hypothetical protein
LFLLTHFHDTVLPETAHECKSLIQSYFPVIYDTKVVATEHTTLWCNENSNLSNLFCKVVRENEDLESKLKVVRPHVVEGQVEEEESNQEHEAAHDAYMTGAIYIGLAQNIRGTSAGESNALVGNLTHLLNQQGDKELRSRYGRNKLYSFSMYTLDLDAPKDPMKKGMLPQSAYRVNGFDTSVTTRDIVQCLSNLFDDSGRKVGFDLVWVDDTTFIGAACYRPTADDASEDDNRVVLAQHGRLVFKALSVRFKGAKVTSLEDYFSSLPRDALHAEVFSQPSKPKVEGGGLVAIAENHTLVYIHGALVLALVVLKWWEK